MKQLTKENQRCLHHYVYCDDILGVETNIKDFRWIYGSSAETSKAEAYERCGVRFRVLLEKEAKLGEPSRCDAMFQSFMWENESRSLFYRRKIAGSISVGYNIILDENETTVVMGENYYKFVKGRVMHLHDAYYLLSDLANIMLLKRGYLTLYASAVHFEKQNRGVVCFAPPNTGKTLTAAKLSKLPGVSLVGEDVVITNFQNIFSCPYTRSYRKGSSRFDSAGAFRRTSKHVDSVCNTCLLTDLVVLSLGQSCGEVETASIFNKINVLNGYLFEYYSSPIVKVLAYFDCENAEDWCTKASRALGELCSRMNCLLVQAEYPQDFCSCIQGMISGEQK